MAQRHGNQLPPLWLRFREIKAINDHKHPNKTECGEWLPPLRTKDFRTTQDWQWHILRPGNNMNANQFTKASVLHDDNYFSKHVKIHDTTSVFFSTEINHFFEVPYDCTEEDVSERKAEYPQDGWHRFTFTRSQDFSRDQQRNLWFLGHALDKIQMSDVNITDCWDDLLLPGCFLNSVRNRNTPPTCELAGKLSMIFATVAFATPPDNLISFVENSFRPYGTSHYSPPSYLRREEDRGRTHQRGLVVDVAYDETDITKQHIEAWEEAWDAVANPGMEPNVKKDGVSKEIICIAQGIWASETHCGGAGSQHGTL